MRHKELTANDVWKRKKTPEDMAIEKARQGRIDDANRERSLSSFAL